MAELRLVLVRYYDHVEFRNRDYSQLKPLLREVVGWIAHEDGEKLILLVEKPVTNNIQEIAELRPSGFVIIRSAIKEIVGLC